MRKALLPLHQRFYEGSLRERHRIFYLVAFAIISGLLVCGCGFFERKAKIRIVIDGDTIQLEDGTLVRYIGIDAPKLRKKSDQPWIEGPQPGSLQAKLLNERLVGTKIVRLEFDTQREDKQGCLLAYCFAGDVFINAELLRSGYAALSLYPSNTRYNQQLIQAYNEARQKKAGLWANMHLVRAQDASRITGKIALVEGRVYRTRERWSVIELLLEEKHPCKVVIYKVNLGSFRAAGISVQDAYFNKNIRVCGRFENSDGPSIIVDDPSQIEIVG